MIERFKDFEFLLDTSGAKKYYFFNAHVSKGCFRTSELESFYHKRISEYLQQKLQQPTSSTGLPKEIRYICFDRKIELENHSVWVFSVIVDDEGLHELYKLSNLRLYYRIIPPEEELEVIDH